MEKYPTGFSACEAVMEKSARRSRELNISLKSYSSASSCVHSVIVPPFDLRLELISDRYRHGILTSFVTGDDTLHRIPAIGKPARNGASALTLGSLMLASNTTVPRPSNRDNGICLSLSEGKIAVLSNRGRSRDAYRREVICHNRLSSQYFFGLKTCRAMHTLQSVKMETSE